MNIRKSVLALLRVGMGALFLLAGTSKGADIEKFEEEIRLYYIVPVMGVPFVAAVIIAFETVAGLAFVVGKGVREAASALSALCACFLVVLLVRIVGGVPGECGCWGGMMTETIGPAAVARDGIFLVICITIGREERIPGLHV